MAGDRRSESSSVFASMGLRKEHRYNSESTESASPFQEPAEQRIRSDHSHPPAEAEVSGRFPQNRARRSAGSTRGTGHWPLRVNMDSGVPRRQGRARSQGGKLAITRSLPVSELTEQQQVVIHEAATRAMDFTAKNFRYVTTEFGDFVRKVKNGEMVYLRALSHEKPSERPAMLADDFPALASDFLLPPQLSLVKENLFSSVLRLSGPVNMWLHYDVRDAVPTEQSHPSFFQYINDSGPGYGECLLPDRRFEATSPFPSLGR